MSIANKSTLITGDMSEITNTSDRQKGAEATVESFRKDLGPFVVAAETTRMAMLFTDGAKPDNLIIFANDSLLDPTGYSREEMLGKDFNFLTTNSSDSEALRRTKAEFEGSSSGGTEVLYRRRTGANSGPRSSSVRFATRTAKSSSILHRSLISSNTRMTKSDPGC